MDRLEEDIVHMKELLEELTEYKRLGVLGAALRSAATNKPYRGLAQILLGLQRGVKSLTRDAIQEEVGYAELKYHVPPVVGEAAATCGVRRMDHLLTRSFSDLEEAGMNEETLVALLKYLHRLRYFSPNVTPAEIRNYPDLPFYLVGHQIKEARRMRPRRKDPQ